MAEYLSPGVYVEEFDSGVKAMEGVGTSTAGFVGLAQKGLVSGRPELLTSFADYTRKFGGYLTELQCGSYRFLPYAVEQFFVNGGSTCYVMRVVPEDAVCARSPEGAPIEALVKNPGEWGNRIGAVLRRSSKAKTQILSVSEGDGGKKYELKSVAGFDEGDVVQLVDGETTVFNRVKMVNGKIVTFEKDFDGDVTDTGIVPQKILSTCELDLTLGYADVVETYPQISLNEKSARYLPAAVQKSELAAFTLHLEGDLAVDPLTLLGAEADAAELRIAFSGGLDGSIGTVSAATFNGVDGGPGKRTGIEAFKELSDVSIMAVPGVTMPEVQANLISHCENLASRFAVLDIPYEMSSVADLNQHKSLYDSTYAAIYHPWLQVFDPAVRRNAFIPPSGSICGIYARTDVQRGVFKAPANEIVRNCTGLSVNYNAAEQGKLNPNGVNLIRSIPGQGIRVWGARTCSSDGNWKYINVRRLFIFLEESIKANTNWAVFEPNDEVLWSRVEGTIRIFLTTQWRNGALMGSSADEAFYVNVGRSTMSPDDILNGRLICEIGVAPVRPAEFVIFRITQKMEEAQ